MENCIIVMTGDTYWSNSIKIEKPAVSLSESFDLEKLLGVTAGFIVSVY